MGEQAFQLYLENCRSPQHTIASKNRNKQYPLYATEILTMGDPGSSAGGEQPKFTTILLPENQHVIVQFSPPTTTDIGIRIADLLICEYIALLILKKHGQNAADAEIIAQDDRIFLEVKRFDRIDKFSRLGLISLRSLDAEFSGVSNSWSKISAELAKNKIIPMKFNPPLPLATDKKIWNSVFLAAIEFWNEIIKDDRISPSFEMIAEKCKEKITGLQELAALLPKQIGRSIQPHYLNPRCDMR